MSDNVTSLGATPDSTYGQGQSPRPSPESADKAVSEADAATPSDPADMRLIIEDDHAGGPLTYTTVDGRTGAVVRKLPGEQVLRLRETKTYVAGQVIKTRV